MQKKQKNLLAQEIVMVELQKLALYYRDVGVDKKTLPILSDMYMEDLTGMSCEEFVGAVRLARKRCRFFPKAVDILEAAQEWRTLHEGGRSEPSKLPPALSQEQMEQNKAHCRRIMAMLRHAPQPGRQGRLSQPLPASPPRGGLSHDKDCSDWTGHHC